MSPTARLGACVAALLLSGGCGDRGRAPGDSAAAPARRAQQAAGGAAASSACPATGHWTACQVRKRLEQAGVAPRDTAVKALGDLPRLGVSPIALEVGSAGLAVYLFPDSTARRRAAGLLDTAQFVGPAHELTMSSKATAIESDNLLALLFSHRDQQRERVSDALLAGPPQP